MKLDDLMRELRSRNFISKETYAEYLTFNPEQREQLAYINILEIIKILDEKVSV